MRASCLCSRAGALLYLLGLRHADTLPLCDDLRRQSARGIHVILKWVMMGAYNDYAKCKVHKIASEVVCKHHAMKPCPLESIDYLTTEHGPKIS